MGEGLDGSRRVRTSEVTRDVVALGASGPTILPFAGQAQIACALSADVIIA